IGAHSDEIAFVNNTSVGMNVIADLLPRNGSVAASTLEFPAATLPWVHRAVPIHWVSPEDGIPTPAAFSLPSTPETSIIVLSHVQFSNGSRQTLREFASVKGNRSLVVCASQSLGAFPVDVVLDQVDALAVSGHKWLCAGYGAGFLYVSRKLLQASTPTDIGWL